MSFSDHWKKIQSSQSDSAAKISHDNLIRWWVSILSLLAAFILWAGSYVQTIGPVIGLFLFYNFVQGISWLLVKSNHASRGLDLALHIIDNLAITCSIHWTGGLQSTFSFLYVIPIIVEAYHKNLKGVVLNGLIGISLYAGLLFGLGNITQQSHEWTEVITRLAFLATFSAVAGVSVTLLRKQDRILQKHLIEQETITRIHELVNNLTAQRNFKSLAESIASELTQNVVKPFWHVRVWLSTEEPLSLEPHGDCPGALQELEHLPANSCPAFKNRISFHRENIQDRPCPTEQFTYGSHLCLPIAVKEEAFGVLFVGSPQENAFSEDDVKFLDTVTKTLALGMERISELQKLQFSYEVGTSALAAFLSSTKGMDETVSAILEGVVRILGVDRANLMLWEPELKVLQSRWFRGTPPPPLGRITLQMGEGIAGLALKHNQPYWSSDVEKDPNFVPSQGRIRSLLAMPMRTSDNKPLGVINALTLENSKHFSRRDVDFLGLFAKQAAMAIENAMLHEEGSRKIGHLEALDQIKSEFLSRISHELRGPLTAIQGFSEVLAAQTNGELNTKQLELLDQVIQQAKVQLRMVEDLLDVSSIERGSWSINKAPCSLRQILSEEYEKAKMFAQARNIKVIMDLPSAPIPDLVADSERLHQAIWNLLHNAIKYSLEGGTIGLILDVRKNNFLVSVRDTGRGLPLDSLEKIFEKFTQAHGEESKRIGGLGLGLALVKEIVEAHNGRVQAESPGLDKGSTFTITLPLTSLLQKEKRA